MKTPPWQISALLPASTITAGVMCRIISSFRLTQLPLPKAVRVKVTLPISSTPGVYVGVKVLALVNDPVPDVAHKMELKLLAVAAVDCEVKLNTTPSQISSSLPADTITDGVMARI